MRAVLGTGDPDMPIRVADVAEPVPGPDEVLIRVRAVGINRGELTRLERCPPGSRIGWDVLGTALGPAPPGPGTPITDGADVLALAPATGWADLVAVPRSRVVAVAADPDIALAALPVAALTALLAIRRAGPLLGARVLVTGATGGVGGLLTQLARASGAEVEAVGRRPDSDAVREPVDVVFDNVGGSTLESAFGAVRPGGTVVVTGNTSREPLRLPADWGHARPAVTLTYLHLFDELTRSRPAAVDLDWLARRWTAGELELNVTHRGRLDGLAETLRALRARAIHGKAVVAWPR